MRNHQYWAVAFIDILGQRAAMRAIDFIPDQSNPKQMDDFIAGIKKVYGAVTFIQESFQNWAKGHDARPPGPEIAKLTTEQQAIAQTMKATPLRFQRFSDGLMIYMSLADATERSPIAGMFSLFGACATVMLSSIAGKTPIRGGIDVGTGMEMAENELYGPVVARAYELESGVAQYPRIVVGDGCVKYLNLHGISTETGYKADFERKMAQICSDLLMIDVDGHPTVDFLGDGFRRHIAQGLDSKLIVMAHEYVVAQLEDARKRRDTVLSFRYMQLLNYFEAKMQSWVMKT